MKQRGGRGQAPRGRGRAPRGRGGRGHGLSEGEGQPTTPGGGEGGVQPSAAKKGCGPGPRQQASSIHRGCSSASVKALAEVPLGLRAVLVVQQIPQHRHDRRPRHGGGGTHPQTRSPNRLLTTFLTSQPCLVIFIPPPTPSTPPPRTLQRASPPANPFRATPAPNPSHPHT